MLLKLVGVRLVEVTRAAEFNFLHERGLLQLPKIAFCPRYFPTVQAFVRIRRAQLKRFFRTVLEFPAIHVDPPFRDGLGMRQKIK